MANNLEIDITIRGAPASGKTGLARVLISFLRLNAPAGSHLIVSTTDDVPNSNNYDILYCGVLGGGNG